MIGIRRCSQRQAVLQALAQAGGSMEYDDFRRLLATVYPTEGRIASVMSHLRSKGMIQRRVHLTATGSARLSKTLP